MAVIYLDTSALIKRYVAETGSAWIASFAFDAPDTILVTSRLTIAEARSAFARRRREASISTEDHADTIAAFNEDCVQHYRFVELDTPVIELACELMDRHPLRTNDAVQLASALLSNQALRDAGVAALIFVSADERLVRTADAEGLPADNPSLHP